MTWNNLFKGKKEKKKKIIFSRNFKFHQNKYVKKLLKF